MKDRFERNQASLYRPTPRDFLRVNFGLLRCRVQPSLSVCSSRIADKINLYMNKKRRYLP